MPAPAIHTKKRAGDKPERSKVKAPPPKQKKSHKSQERVVDSSDEDEDEETTTTGNSRSESVSESGSEDEEETEEIEETETITGTGSDEESESEPDPQPKAKDSNAAAAHTYTYTPPPNFKIIPPSSSFSSSSSSNPFSTNNLAGKELWFITAPVSAPVHRVTGFNPADIAAGAPVIQTPKRSYSLRAQDASEETTGIELALPDGRGGYHITKTPITRSFRVVEVLPIPAAITADQIPKERPVRAQPDGLWMRFKPIGYVDVQQDGGGADNGVVDVEVRGHGHSGEPRKKKKKKREDREDGEKREKKKHRSSREKHGRGSSSKV